MTFCIGNMESGYECYPSEKGYANATAKRNKQLQRMATIRKRGEQLKLQHKKEIREANGLALAATNPITAALVLLSGCGARSGLLEAPQDGGEKVDSRIPDGTPSCPHPNMSWVFELQGKNGIGEKVVVDGSGNSYVVGSIMYGGGPSQAIVLKFDPAGKLIGQNFLATGGINSEGRDILLDKFGNVLVGGNVEISAQKLVPFVAKYDSTIMNQLWPSPLIIKNNNNMTLRGMTIAPDSSIYFTGMTNGSSPNSSDIVIGKVSPDGKYLLGKNYDYANSDDRGEAIASDPSGNLYITGFTSPTYSQSDIFIGKVDRFYNNSWSKFYGANSLDSGHGIAVDKTGNSYVVGETGVKDFWVSKQDTYGNLLWQDNFQSSPDITEAAEGITVDKFGNVFALGLRANKDATVKNALVKKYTSDGKPSWVKSFDELGNSSDGNGIAVDNKGSLYMTGAADINSTLRFSTLWVGKYRDCP